MVAGAHLLAVASPGPDFALVMRQSLVHGRRTAVWTSLGIGAGILVHVGYSVLGFALLIRGSATWFAAVKYAGASYLVWLGVQAWRSRPRGDESGGAAGQSAPAAGAAFAGGFLTNALNPKATLFFLALFATVISATTPRLWQTAYGLWMSVATAGWFSLISTWFARERVRRTYLRYSHWIDRTLAVLFLGFAASLLVARLR